MTNFEDTTWSKYYTHKVCLNEDDVGMILDQLSYDTRFTLNVIGDSQPYSTFSFTAKSSQRNDIIEYKLTNDERRSFITALKRSWTHTKKSK